MLTVTEAAISHIRELVTADGRQGVGLRLFIDSGGCSGKQYNMTIDSRHDGDLQVLSGGAEVYIDTESATYLKGSVIDFEDGLTNTGFRILNPNAKQTCGCGTSFEAA